MGPPVWRAECGQGRGQERRWGVRVSDQHPTEDEQSRPSQRAGWDANINSSSSVNSKIPSLLCFSSHCLLSIFLIESSGKIFGFYLNFLSVPSSGDNNRRRSGYLCQEWFLRWDQMRLRWFRSLGSYLVSKAYHLTKRWRFFSCDSCEVSESCLGTRTVE